MKYTSFLPVTRALSATTGRRTVLTAIGGAGLAMAQVPARGAAEEATPALRPPVEGAVFLGVTSDPDTYIALTSPGEEAGEAHAYVCDGRKSSLWCSGPAETELMLKSEEGAIVTAHLASESASGEATLPDGRVLSFAVEPATSIAGLYDVVLMDGTVSGTAGDGQRLNGEVVEELEDGSRLLAGTIEQEDGSLHAFATFASPDATGAMHWIVLADGRLKGGRQKDRGTGWINSEQEPAR